MSAVPRPAAPLAAAVPLHEGGHVHSHGNGHGHDHHDHAHDAPQEAPPALPASLLMAGAGSRLLGTLGVLVLLWLAVAWALGEPA